MGVKRILDLVGHLASKRLPSGGKAGEMDQAFARLLKLARHVIEGFRSRPDFIQPAGGNTLAKIASRYAAQASGQPLHRPADARHETRARPRPPATTPTPRLAGRD